MDARGKKTGFRGIIAQLFRPFGAIDSVTAELIKKVYGGSETAAGITVTPDKAMRLATVASCVRVLAESVAQLPCHLYQVQGRNREKAVNNESHLIGVQPNEWMSPYDMKLLIMVHLLLRGNSVWLKTFGTSGEIRELIPVHPDRLVKIVQDPLYRLFYEIRRPDKTIDTVPADRLVHYRGLSFDGIVGMNPIEYLRESIALSIAAQTHGAKMFAQGARLGVVLSHPKKLSLDAQRNMRESFDEQYAGLEKAHRTAVLEEGVKASTISMTAEDAQFLESRQYQRSEIAGFFRTPAHLINDLTHATYSNVEYLDLAYVKHSLTPWLVGIEQTNRRDILTAQQRRDGFYYRFNVEGLLRGDSAARSTLYKEAIWNGERSPNEIRELDELNPYEGGDTFYIPGNLVPVTGDRAGKPAPKEPATPEEQRRAIQ